MSQQNDISNFENQTRLNLDSSEEFRCTLLLSITVRYNCCMVLTIAITLIVAILLGWTLGHFSSINCHKTTNFVTFFM